ncbi:midasin [Anopheles maculipalpis]|uniref:midasin n=1 Tax=Anopheles maculipalpis TaxID=1496333 RepID=UPI0021592E0D|nr:midasin [Anopheles maculipalpis]
MPTQKKKVKKATETSESKPAVDIKQEPEELKPLGAYVDDRLELIRQVFSCVKPKEIKYLLPDFLEGKSNDVIKERCLDELLGISTKRLHSIINNTKCPTDTESSSEEEGSDVEKIEEHISLDEISSDSDVDSKRTSKRGKKADASKQTDERNGEPKSEKEMTVLELLELQARARAIRSQLALEPVTKIEIDSEHEAEDGGRHGDVDTDDESKQSGSKSSEQAKNGNHFKKENNNSNSLQQTKRVRLKRNFRIRKVGDEEDDEHEVSSNPPDNGREKSTEKSMEAVELEEKVTENPDPEEKATESDNLIDDKNPTTDQALSENATEKDTETTIDSDANVVTAVVTDENAPLPDVANDAIEKDTPVPEDATELRKPDEGNETRESSPEVIPVEASPETLCISSDSEEERLAKERASIFVPNIEELDRQAKKPPTPEPEKPAEDTEPEEGEISEEEPLVEEEPIIAEQQADPTDKAATETEQPLGDEGEKDDGTDHVKIQDTVAETTVEAAQETVVQTLSSGSEGSDGSSSSGSSSESSSEAEEDEEAKAEPTKMDHSAQDDEDIVEIHDSGDENLLLEDKPPEEEVPKSWNSRWLKSNRVAKVMAASRLGNKVREKLKKKKQIQQAAEQQQAQQEPPVVANLELSQASPKLVDTVAELPPNFELGSVEHYRELVAKQQQEGKQD